MPVRLSNRKKDRLFSLLRGRLVRSGGGPDGLLTGGRVDLMAGRVGRLRAVRSGRGPPLKIHRFREIHHHVFSTGR